MKMKESRECTHGLWYFIFIVSFCLCNQVDYFGKYKNNNEY